MMVPSIDADALRFTVDARSFNVDVLRFSVDGLSINDDAPRFSVDGPGINADAPRFIVDGRNITVEHRNLIDGWHIIVEKPDTTSFGILLFQIVPRCW